MKKQIWPLFALRGADELSAFTEQFAACCAWVKLNESNKLSEEHQLFVSGSSVKERLQKVMDDCVSVQYHAVSWSLSDKVLHQLVTSLQDLVRTKVICYQDLSVAITNLLEEGGKKSGELTIPDELTRLGVSLLGEKIESVYCPFTAGYEFAHKLPLQSLVEGETPLRSDEFYAEVQNVLLDRNFRVTCTDPISVPTLIGDGGLKQFQSSIAMPPFGLKYATSDIHDIWGRFPEKSLMADVYQLRHMLAHASDCVVGFVTNGFLYRSAAGEKLFKQDVVNRNWLKAVIALPSNLLSLTSIPVSIMVFDKHKVNDSVLFIDASSRHFIDKSSRVRNKLTNNEQILSIYNSFDNSEFSKLCSIEDIEAMDYNLSPSRYVLTNEDMKLKHFLEQYPTAKLSELVEIVRPQALKHDADAEVEYIEHNLTSLNTIGQLEGDGKLIKVSTKDVVKAEKQKIQAGDVLVSCRGAVGRVALIDDRIEDNVIASQAFAILRLKPHVNNLSSVALYQYFTSEFGQQQLSSLVTGTTAQMLSAKDLSNMNIPVFSAEKLAELEAVRLKVIEVHQKILGLQKEIEQINLSWLAQKA
ncbi:N-6 DNA methylase [Vibrio fluvialis]|uniref:N-6 DNA methylase n=1 Tax=Vibrio fluvialis TaxID=676 RepID=UPI00192C4883|nr:N-6 DNA methylase [Vibrio fluvialis]MBL4244675.1 N-6 DNA methylase [Vibrio fluvialis]MBL4253571.1 N-6 DNA methylase [Vibrio fluvialis]